MASPRPHGPRFTASLLLALCCSLGSLAGCSDDDSGPVQPVPGGDDLAQGKETFRFDTFGDETFWTDTLRMHEVIQAAVESARPRSRSASRWTPTRCPPRSSGHPGRRVDLTDPATTVALLKLNAVVGLKGTVRDDQRQGHPDRGRHHLRALPLDGEQLVRRRASARGSTAGPTCDLNPGAIIALSPALTAEQKAVYNSWGPGKYDPATTSTGRTSRR